MKYFIRYIHKYLSFFISIQLLLWTISGIFFAFNKIELVRGEQYRVIQSNSVDLGKFNFKIENIANAQITKRLDQEILIIEGDSGAQYLDIKGGSATKLSFEEAKKIVENLQEYGSNKTMVIITHRNPILAMVDRVLVVENGNVVADNTPGELGLNK